MRFTRAYRNGTRPPSIRSGSLEQFAGHATDAARCPIGSQPNRFTTQKLRARNRAASHIVLGVGGSKRIDEMHSYVDLATPLLSWTPHQVGKAQITAFVQNQRHHFIANASSGSPAVPLRPFALAARSAVPKEPCFLGWGLES